MLYGALCEVHVNQYTCLYVRKQKKTILCWKCLGPSVQNLVDQVTSGLGFMHPSLSPYFYFVYVDIPCGTESGATTENYEITSYT